MLKKLYHNREVLHFRCLGWAKISTLFGQAPFSDHHGPSWGPSDHHGVAGYRQSKMYPGDVDAGFCV